MTGLELLPDTTNKTISKTKQANITPHKLTHYHALAYKGSNGEGIAREKKWTKHYITQTTQDTLHLPVTEQGVCGAEGGKGRALTKIRYHTKQHSTIQLPAMELGEKERKLMEIGQHQ